MDGKPIFRPSFGNRPDRLVGRFDVVEEILTGLRSYPGSQERAPLVLGQRGMGKTALLLEIADRAEGHGFVCARATCGKNMLEDLVDQLRYSGAQYVQEPKRPIKGFGAGALGFSFGLTFTEEAHRNLGFRTKLEMICDRLAESGKGVLLLLDEASPAQEEVQTLVKAYQEIAGNEKDIALVVAGLPSAVSEILSTKTLAFFSRARRVDLEPVPIREVQAYFRSAFKRAGRTVSDDLVEQAAHATGGLPYMLQLVGYYLVLFSDEVSPVTRGVFDQAIDAAREEFETKVLQAVLKELSGGDIAFLCAMAQDRKTTRVADLQHRLGISQGAVQTYRRRLLDAGVIEAPRRGEVAFALPMLADYLSGQE